jgi:hypothetical protein
MAAGDTPDAACRAAASRPESTRRASPLRAPAHPGWAEAIAALEAADQVLEDARAAVAAASDGRALAVFAARRAGVPLRIIGTVIGTAHPNVPAIERRGAELAVRPPAPLAVAPGPEETSPTSRPENTHRPLPGRRCLREGCPFPAADGARFCTPHRWS